MEMTGLDPEKEGILEMATIVTDAHLKVLSNGPNLVIHQPPKLLKAMDEWNQKHHAKSGLIEAAKASTMTVRKAEKLTLAFITEYCVPQKALLCGNAVHHDRKFIHRYMPRLDRFLHYRHIDVSTIKALIQLWYPKDKNLPKKKTAHRALDDIRESIEELRYYREHYFRSVPVSDLR
jgi:oligoribonuclease